MVRQNNTRLWFCFLGHRGNQQPTTTSHVSGDKREAAAKVHRHAWGTRETHATGHEPRNQSKRVYT